jgi:uncharacterized protein YjbI with pentapeptide repeats
VTSLIGSLSEQFVQFVRWWRRSLPHKHLLPAVGITVLLGAAIATALTFFLTWLVLKVPPTGALPTPGPDGNSPFLDVLKVALTVSAGIGGAVALVVAYRRQRHLEVDDAGRRSRYTSAAQQLGDPQAAVRLAGVYAMAHLADEWAEQRQQCVDVLCAYLRLPWAGDTTQLEPNTTTTEHTWPDGGGQRKVTKTYSGRAGEREVRQTIVRVIASHLRPVAGWGVGWSDLDIDLTNAALPNANFSDANFRGRTSFARATFSGSSSFNRAQFSGDASFAETQFSGHAFFGGATFSGSTNFGDAKFFGDASFGDAKFLGDASFGDAHFAGDALFRDAHFAGDANFRDAKFSSREVYFDNAHFAGGAYFGDAKFSGVASFEYAKFSGGANFSKAQFSVLAFFAGVQFYYASFRDAKFDVANFSDVQCSRDASFDNSQFSRKAYLDGAQFSGRTFFRGVQFSGGASFDRSTFSDHALFDKAQFSNDGSSFAGASLPSRSVFASALEPPSEEALKGAVYRDEQSESPQASRPAPGSPISLQAERQSGH